jgi:hypothetical protein
MFRTCLGYSSYHVKNLEKFIHTLASLHVGLQDILASYDAILLFTKALIRDALNL